MSDQTIRFSLPFLDAGQAQKEVTHNEALASIDLLLHASVEAFLVDTPPIDPAPGACWIVGTAPTGDWAGQAENLAGWTTGGWRFAVPQEGMMAWSKADGLSARRATSSWIIGNMTASQLLIGGLQVVGARQSGISSPSGGGVVDAEARVAISSVLTALRAHGLITP